MEVSVVDLALQIVGMIVLPTILIVISAVDYLRNRRNLSYSILTDTPLLGLEDETAGRLQIIFDSEPVRNVHLIDVKVLNSGKQPIKPEEYEEPISLNLAEGRILLADVAQKSSPDLRIDLSNDDKKVTLSPPHLLNAGEWMVIRMLASRPAGFRVGTRIVGIRSVGQSTEGRARSLFLVALGLLFAIVGLGFSLLFIPSSESGTFVLLPRASLFSPPLIGLSLLFVLGFFMIMAGIDTYQHWTRDIANLFKRTD
jgi:hypothetical protein